MTGDATVGQIPETEEVDDGSEREGAERYLWVYREGNEVVLSIPGIRDLKLAVEEARSVGTMLLEAANEVSPSRRRQPGNTKRKPKQPKGN